MNEARRSRFREIVTANWRWLALSAGVAITVAVIAATLVPIEDRPRIPIPVDIERSLAFTALVAAYVAARPKRWVVILAMAVVLAGLLELAQALTASRHGTVHDAGIKMAGCALGAALGLIVESVSERVFNASRKAT